MQPYYLNIWHSAMLNEYPVTNTVLHKTLHTETAVSKSWHRQYITIKSCIVHRCQGHNNNDGGINNTNILFYGQRSNYRCELFDTNQSRFQVWGIIMPRSCHCFILFPRMWPEPETGVISAVSLKNPNFGKSLYFDCNLIISEVAQNTSSHQIWGHSFGAFFRYLPQFVG